MDWNPVHWGEDAYNWAAGNPKGQKDAYQQAGQGYSNLGSNVQNQYGNLNDLSQSYYSGTTNQTKQSQSDARLNQLEAKRKATDGTQISDAELNELSTLQQQAYKNGYTQDKSTGQWTAPAGGNPTANAADANGPISPDQALKNQTANQSTQLQDYYKYMQGQAGQQTNQEQFYSGIKGSYGDLTNEETLYNERKGGNDPAAAYQDQRATQALDNAAAARGGYNSGAALRSTSDYYANANAQRSQQLAQLAGGADASRATKLSGYENAAGGADTSRANVNNSLGNAASGASKEQSDYYSGISNQATKLAADKAGISQDILSKGIEAYQSGQVASIDAYLAKAGVDAKAIAAFNSTLSAVGGAAGKAFAGPATPPPGAPPAA